MARITEKELLDHIKQYNDQMVAITSKTAKQVEVLKSAIVTVNTQKESFWRKYKPIIMVLIYVVAILVILFSARQMGYCSVSIESFTKGGAQVCK